MDIYSIICYTVETVVIHIALHTGAVYTALYKIINKIMNLRAEVAQLKSQYAAGELTYDEMYERAALLISKANKRAEEIAKEHGMKHKPISVLALLR